jgi:GNAT superfamily N-acetyltransferase
MIIQLHATDLALVIDFKSRQLQESGYRFRPADWQARSLARYHNLYKEGKCLHLGYRSDQQVAGLAGAWLCDETPFLATQTVRHALLIDEYVLPEHRSNGIAGCLRDSLLARLAEMRVRLTTEIPANTARLASAAGNLRW